MKLRAYIVCMLSLLQFLEASPRQLVQHWSASPQYNFIENCGQIIDQNYQSNPDVKYLFPGKGLNVQLRQHGWSYEVVKVEREEPKISEATGLPDEKDEEIKYSVHRVDVHLIGNNPRTELIPYEP